MSRTSNNVTPKRLPTVVPAINKKGDLGNPDMTPRIYTECFKRKLFLEVIKILPSFGRLNVMGRETLSTSELWVVSP